MKTPLIILSALLLSACVPAEVRELDRMMTQNRYLELSQVPAPDSVVGEWTGAIAGAGIVSYDIRPDGSVTVCGETMPGRVTAKVYQDGEVWGIATQSGGELAFQSVTPEEITLSEYGIDRVYYRGKTGPNCSKVFAKVD